MSTLRYSDPLNPSSDTDLVKYTSGILKEVVGVNKFGVEVVTYWFVDDIKTSTSTQ